VTAAAEAGSERSSPDLTVFAETPDMKRHPAKRNTPDGLTIAEEPDGRLWRGKREKRIGAHFARRIALGEQYMT